MQKPLLEHLIELRQRLIYCLGAFFLVFLVAYHFAPAIFQFLVQPLADLIKGEEGRRLIYTGLTEAFLTYLSVAFFAALFVTLPLILWQVWSFVSPGLYKAEKRVFAPFFMATPVLFLLGAAMAYYIVCPMAWEFFLSFETPATVASLPLQLEARVSEYLSLVLKLIFAFGLSFQLPVVLVLLAKSGILTAEQLASKRKYAFLAIVVVAAIITPPDIISPISLIIPLYALYEISLVLVKGVEKKLLQEEESRV